MNGSILIPWVKPAVHLETVKRALLTVKRWQVEPVRVSGTDPTAYWKVLHMMWRIADALEEQFAVIEHDVKVNLDTFSKFDDCPEPVCAAPYWIGTCYEVGLGCTRFRADFIRNNRDLWDKVGEIDNDGLPKKDWHRLDTRLWQVMKRDHLGEVHRHDKVTHLHRYGMPEPEPEEAA